MVESGSGLKPLMYTHFRCKKYDNYMIAGGVEAGGGAEWRVGSSPHSGQGIYKSVCGARGGGGGGPGLRPPLPLPSPWFNRGSDKIVISLDFSLDFINEK